MTVVCGTDFSDHAEGAVRVSAAFAAALRVPLLLVHVVDRGAVGWTSGAIPMQCAEAATERLAQIAASLTAPDLELETQVLIGLPDEELIRLAQERSAQMLIVGVLGARSSERWRVGSLAARLAHAVPAPVLLVSDAAPFEACSRGERPLRVLVATDRSLASDAAVRWLPTLHRLGPCDATLVHLYDPVAESRRLGTRDPVSLVRPNPEIETLLERELLARVGEIAGPGTTVIRISPWLSWPADGLIEVAEIEHFDLVLVGGGRRGGLAVIRHESVSDRLLQRAPSSVLRVPCEGAHERPTAIARFRRVLVSTDLSPIGDSVVPFAYALVVPGGHLHLLHVLDEPQLPNPLYAHYRPGPFPEPGDLVERKRAAEQRLRALVPRDAAQREIETHIEVAIRASAAEEIRATAERLDVDAVCMATHGRSGISKLVAGSVASAVAATSTKPLLMLRPAPDD